MARPSSACSPRSSSSSSWAPGHRNGWGKNRIRALLVSQANQYLTATLSIGRLEGSLLRGIRLSNVDVARGTQTLIHIDEIAVAYSIRELVQRGIVIRAVTLTRPRIVGSKQPDGKWDLGRPGQT
jgi:hypothetical protein